MGQSLYPTGFSTDRSKAELLLFVICILSCLLLSLLGPVSAITSLGKMELAALLFIGL